MFSLQMDMNVSFRCYVCEFFSNELQYILRHSQQLHSGDNLSFYMLKSGKYKAIHTKKPLDSIPEETDIYLENGKLIFRHKYWDSSNPHQKLQSNLKYLENHWMIHYLGAMMSIILVT